jgi:hypothetical protein
VFILEHYFASKLFAAVVKHVIIRVLTRKYQISLQQQHFGTQKCSLSDKIAYITDFKQCISCNNGTRLQEFNIAIVSSFCAWRGSCEEVRVEFLHGTACISLEETGDVKMT